MRVSYTMVGILVELIALALAFLSFFPTFESGSLLVSKISRRMDRFIDMAMAVSFIRDEIGSRITRPGFVRTSREVVSYYGLSDGVEKEITYRIINRKDEGIYKIRREADNEGNNVIYESKNPIWFEKKGRLLILHLESYEFYIHEPIKLENLSNFPGVSRDPLLSPER